MNGAQLHLLVNHVPVLGTVFSAALLGAGLLTRKDEWCKAGLWAMLLSALAALPAFYSGEGAEELVEHLPGVLESLIHDHEEAGEKALIAALVMGAAAVGALVYGAKRGFSRAAATAALAFSLPVIALMAWTAHLGGLVRHTELRSGGGPAPAAPVEDAD